MIELDYKFDDEWTEIYISEDDFIDTLVEFADKYFMVRIDGKNNDVIKLIMEIFDNGSDYFLEELCDVGNDFSEFIHDKFESVAREYWEDGKLLNEE